MNDRLPESYASVPEGFWFFRAVCLCVAFDALLAALFLIWRAVPWLH